MSAALVGYIIVGLVGLACVALVWNLVNGKKEI
jgi:dolichyl-phosphate-mannose--protein O-mannosyl transferase